MNKTVFVTGGSGFIGSRLVCRLVQNGYRVFSILPPGEKLSMPLFDELNADAGVAITSDMSDIGVKQSDILFVRGDIRDKEFVDTLFKACRDKELCFDAIVHLAACSTIQEAVRHEELAWQVNVQGTENLLNAVKRYGQNPDGSFTFGGFIYASTDKVYGEGSEAPYTEEHVLAPRFPYEKSKAAADRLVRNAYAQWGLPTVATRFCNVYGPGDRHLSRLFPGTLHNLLVARTPPVLRMYHDANGELRSFRRDFIYIDDLVDALRLLIEACTQKGAAGGLPFFGEAFNLGTGHCYNVTELMDTLVQSVGGGLMPRVEVVSGGEIAEQCLSYQKAADTLGYTPKTPLTDGLAKTIAWYEKAGGCLDWLE